MTISELRIYPIKSLGGISLTEAVVEKKGFRHDRRFMLVSPEGQFITQRTNHHMALIDVAIAETAGRGDVLRVWHRAQPDNVLEIPLSLPDQTNASVDDQNKMLVSIWDSQHVPAIVVSDEADRWFSRVLDIPCRLVFMPETTYREVEPNYAQPDDQGRLPAVSFADGYPYLLIGQASLDALNRRLPTNEPIIDMIRFRPNIVVAGSLPNEEDTWHQFQIDDVVFYGVKPCARCVLTTINPVTGQKGKEPLRTLSTYRQWKHKILFGQNVCSDPATSGTIRVGQSVTVVSRQASWLDTADVDAAEPTSR